MTKFIRTIYPQAFKAIVAIVLLAFLFIKIDFTESLHFFTRVDFPAIVLIFMVTFWLIFVSVLKWQIFLQSLDLPGTFWSLYRFYIIGYFFSNFLPSNIGGDAVRVTLSAKDRNTYTASFVAVFMERLTGIAATLLFGAVSLPLALSSIQFPGDTFLILLPVFMILFVIAGLFLLRPEFVDYMKPKNKLIRKVFAKLREILASIRFFKNRKQVLWKTMLLSIFFNFLAILNVYVAARVLRVDAGFSDLFIMVPLILLISAIPLSINAIGIAEGAYVLCLGMIGLSAPEALSVALLIRAKTLVVSLLGGLFFIGYKIKHIPETSGNPS